MSPSLVAVEEEPTVVTRGGHSSLETSWERATHGEGRMSCTPTSSVSARISRRMQHCAMRVQGEVSEERTENRIRGGEQHASLAVGTDSDLSASCVPTQSSAQSTGSSAPPTFACQILEHSSPLSPPSDGEMWAKLGSCTASAPTRGRTDRLVGLRSWMSQRRGLCGSVFATRRRVCWRVAVSFTGVRSIFSG